MENKTAETFFIIRQLFETEAFRFLADPVILTSGEIGIYYINTEKLARDNRMFEQFGNNPAGMVEHAVTQAEKEPDFRTVIDILVERVKAEFPQRTAQLVISGGQRRDWLFSGPVAKILDKPHLALYKDGRAELMYDGNVASDFDLSATHAIHVADLITKASSAYDPRQKPPTGWIPMIRRRKGSINTLFCVVDRQQGGTEILSDVGVVANALIAIDERFFGAAYVDGKFTKEQHDTAVAYLRDPAGWSVRYITEKGIAPFVNAFNPVRADLPRAKKFLAVYDSVLRETGRLQELEAAVSERHGMSIHEILNQTLLHKGAE
ncbi:MAG: hypothetical protein KJ574_04880 [Nanoarchaeota archaeon]|nr:hypothetical protein [Nanoarchaeota archaeon]